DTKPRILNFIPFNQDSMKQLPMKPFFCLAFILIVAACQRRPTPSEENLRPTFKNVVFIIGDDHSAEVIGAYGNKVVRTPSLDRMASKGVMFKIGRAHV